MGPKFDDTAFRCDWMLIAQNDDKAAFRRLYDQSFAGFMHYARCFAKDKEVASDAVQELFTKIWTKRFSLVGVKAPYQYMLAALRNILITQANKTTSARTLPIYDSIAEDNYSFRLDDPADHGMIMREENAIRYHYLCESLQSLSSRQKEILYLRFIKGLTFEETADLLQITVKAAYKLSARALETIRELALEKFSSSVG